MEFINKTNDEIKAYTYFLVFEIDKRLKYYYGVRYGNIRLLQKPSEDLFEKYFTSSKSVSNLLESGILPKKVLIHKTFNSIEDACAYEIKFLKRVGAKDRKDFINLVDSFDSSKAYQTNCGRVLSEEVKKQIGKSSKLWQSNKDYRKARSIEMKSKWNDEEYRKYMKSNNDSFWKSEIGKEHIRTRNNSFIGKQHKEETKRLMSEKAKENLKNVDMKKRALNRKRFTCPICNKENLDGGNFNRHTNLKHSWNKEQSQEFKLKNK